MSRLAWWTSCRRWASIRRRSPLGRLGARARSPSARLAVQGEALLDVAQRVVDPARGDGLAQRLDPVAKGLRRHEEIVGEADAVVDLRVPLHERGAQPARSLDQPAPRRRRERFSAERCAHQPLHRRARGGEQIVFEHERAERPQRAEHLGRRGAGLERVDDGQRALRDADPRAHLARRILAEGEPGRERRIAEVPSEARVQRLIRGDDYRVGLRPAEPFRPRRPGAHGHQIQHREGLVGELLAASGRIVRSRTSLCTADLVQDRAHARFALRLLDRPPRALRPSSVRHAPALGSARVGHAPSFVSLNSGCVDGGRHSREPVNVSRLHQDDV